MGHDNPHEGVIIELSPAAAAAAADALAEAAGWAGRDRDDKTARLLAHLADDIEAASVTPGRRRPVVALAPPATASRAARRKKLGLPPAPSPQTAGQ
jgi:hypothetical protein